MRFSVIPGFARIVILLAMDDSRHAIEYYGERYRNGFLKFETTNIERIYLNQLRGKKIDGTTDIILFHQDNRY